MSLFVVLAILAVLVSVAEAAPRQKRQYYGRCHQISRHFIQQYQIASISIWNNQEIKTEVTEVTAATKITADIQITADTIKDTEEITVATVENLTKDINQTNRTDNHNNDAWL